MSLFTLDRVMVTPNMLANFTDLFAPLHQAGIEVVLNTGVYPMSAAQLANWLEDAPAAIIGLDEVTAKVLEACPALKLIARNGVGMDNIDLDAATQYGVLVTAPLGANSTSVAELTLGLMISLVRHVLPVHRLAQAGQWHRIEGLELSGKTLGIIGLGRIGKKVARRAQAFNMHIIANDIAPDNYFAREHQISMLSFNDVLSHADIVSLHVPLTPLTHHLINVDALARMRRGSYLINTARGTVVEIAALVAALDQEHIAGAALDVHPVEQQVDESLRGRDNVITTSHLGAYTIDSLRYTTQMAVASILDVLSGREPEGLVNPGSLIRR